MSRMSKGECGQDYQFNVYLIVIRYVIVNPLIVQIQFNRFLFNGLSDSKAGFAKEFQEYISRPFAKQH